MKKLLCVFLVVLTLAFATACTSTPASVVTRGVIADKVYTNTMDDFTITVSEDWAFSSDEDIAALLGASADEIKAENFSAVAQKMTIVYDVMAYDSKTGASVIVGYHNLGLSYDVLPDEQQYIKDIGTEAGVHMEQGDKTLGDNTYRFGYANVTSTDTAYSQSYCVKRIDDYMMVIIFTAPAGYDMTAMESMFG